MLRTRVLRNVGVLTFTLLLIEFLDELVFGVERAVGPLIRSDLGLSYDQIGLLLGLPSIIGNLVEPFLGILGDVWKRRALVLGGGVVFCVALLLTAISQDFLVLLASFVLFYPASGAFVSLSQATLMDTDPSRHEQNMARWTFAGSLGVVGGTLAASATSALGWSWRWLFFLLAALTALLLVLAWRSPFPKVQHESEARPSFKSGLLNAWRALKRPTVLRWLALLEASDLMLDVLLGFLTFYFVDVVGVPPEGAALAVGLWTGVGLLGDFLLIPLLERVRGISYLRVSAAIELGLYPIFLLAPELWMKLVVLALLGFFNAGWYSILKGQLYSSMPGQSGTVMTVGNVFGLVGGLIPIALGVFAEAYGLGATMWVLLVAPVALLVGLPRKAGGLSAT